MQLQHEFLSKILLQLCYSLLFTFFQTSLTTFIKINNRNFVKSFDLINLCSHWSRSTWENSRNPEGKRIKKLLEGIVIRLTSYCYLLYIGTASPWHVLFLVHIQKKNFNSLHERCLCLYFSTKTTDQDLVNLTNSFAMHTGVYSSWQSIALQDQALRWPKWCSVLNISSSIKFSLFLLFIYSIYVTNRKQQFTGTIIVV